MIRFFLHREQVTLDDSRADETVLAYLRERRRKCGSKEGCASGDCGACTVVVAEPRAGADALHYRAVNSCITFAGALHGRRLLTVEDLAEEGKLHPVQVAMVERHASQCGFCTPGFVMSMFALYQNHAAQKPRAKISRARIEESLGGNLCRCTGYRPIVDAAFDALRNMRATQFSREEARCARKLRAFAKTPARAPNFHLPKTARAAAALLRGNPRARLLGGGTDLALEVTQQLKPLDEIICLAQVRELRGVKMHSTKPAAKLSANSARAKNPRGSFYEIGAAVTLAECGAMLAREYPDLAELLHRFGSTQIRNQATLGGNIANASPVADLPPVFIALGAELVLQRGEKLRRIALEKFFRAYKKTALAKGEFIRAILLPRAAANRKLFAYKISKRIDDDISAVCAVFFIELNGARVEFARIAFGGMAEIPKRAVHCERALRGKTFDERALESAARALQKDFTPIDDARATAEYRMRVSQNLLRRLHIELFDARTATRVTAAA